MADRARMNAAARRADMPLGAWLVQTANLRLAEERVQRVPAGQGAAVTPALTLSPADVAALLQALPGLVGVPGCGRLATKLRGIAHAHLAPYLPTPLP